MEDIVIRLRAYITSRLTVKRWRIFIAGLIIAQFLCCGIASYFNIDFSSQESCRDDVLKEVPIYPNATRVKEDDSRSYPEFGTLRRVYETTDTLDQVLAFYSELASCPDSAASDGSLTCSGRPENNNRIYYEVAINPSESTNSYSMYIGWSCQESG
jgi:hypothetical protein